MGERLAYFQVIYNNTNNVIFLTNQDRDLKFPLNVIYIFLNYQAATDKLTEATKKAKKLDNKPESINDAISFVHDVVGGKLKAAEKENEFVYHEKVPDRASLPEIKGASLVKGTPFDVTDPEIAGQDIFHRWVPMEAHEASSLYRY